ncbi:MAG: hypothetical protein ABIH86_04485 [Planctomycetota bacterium]
MTNQDTPKDSDAPGDDCGCRNRDQIRAILEELLVKPIGRAFDIADAASALASDLPGIKTVKDAVCSHPATPHYRRAALEILEGTRLAINAAFDTIEAYEKSVASNEGVADGDSTDTGSNNAPKQTEG